MSLRGVPRRAARRTDEQSSVLLLYERASLSFAAKGRYTSLSGFLEPS